ALRHRRSGAMDRRTLPLRTPNSQIYADGPLRHRLGQRQNPTYRRPQQLKQAAMTYTTKLENWLPEQARMAKIWKLLQYDHYKPLATTDDTYISALRDNIAYHYRQNDFYRDLLNAR